MGNLLAVENTRLEEFTNRHINNIKNKLEVIKNSYIQLLVFNDLLSSFHALLSNKFSHLHLLKQEQQEPIAKQYKLKIKKLDQHFAPLLATELEDYYTAKSFLEEHYNLYLAQKAIYQKEHLEILQKSKQQINHLKYEVQQLQQQKTAITRGVLTQNQLRKKQEKYSKDLAFFEQKTKEFSDLQALYNWAKNRDYRDFWKQLFS